MNLSKYLEATEIIDWQTPAVSALAKRLGLESSSPQGTARACFQWVRDEIKHSGDAAAEVVTCRASEVLNQATGWCFGKSHLLAALLRANGLPAGICYQRLRRDDGLGFTLHGLNAVYLPDYGWYRIDARGNKAGVNAQFIPPREQLAWPAVHPGEADLPEIWADPLPIIVAYLTKSRSLEEARKNLPDIELLTNIVKA